MSRREKLLPPGAGCQLRADSSPEGEHSRNRWTMRTCSAPTIREMNPATTSPRTANTRWISCPARGREHSGPPHACRPTSLFVRFAGGRHHHIPDPRRPSLGLRMADGRRLVKPGLDPIPTKGERARTAASRPLGAGSGTVAPGSVGGRPSPGRDLLLDRAVDASVSWPARSSDRS